MPKRRNYTIHGWKELKALIEIADAYTEAIAKNPDHPTEQEYYETILKLWVASKMAKSNQT